MASDLDGFQVLALVDAFVELNKANDALDLVFHELLSRNSFKKLRKIMFRKGRCVFNVAVNGGNGLVMDGWMAVLTDHRIRDKSNSSNSVMTILVPAWNTILCFNSANHG